MKNIIKYLSLVIALLFVTSAFAACEKESGIVLTEHNQEIADTIYANIKTWERKSTGAACRYSYLQMVEGSLYFECVYTDNQPSTKYRISNGKFIEDDYFASGDTYMTGRLLTVSMPDYNISATSEEKKIYVENLVKEMQDPQKWQELRNK